MVEASKNLDSRSSEAHTIIIRKVMNLSYKENYWDSLELKVEFISFLLRIHGVDLSSWDKLGFWDQKYRPFSYFSGASLVSNVCIYSIEMTIQGKRSLGAQISAVGTLPEFRRQGLSLKLTRRAMDWARENHDFFFLFADQDSYDFYRKCGFRPADEYKTCISVSRKVAQTGCVKLDTRKSDHVEQIYRIASNREPVSDVLGVSNKKLFMFWCLDFLSDHIYYISDLDVLVLYKRDNGLVTIFDIVGTEIPEFSKLYPYISRESDETIEFLFMTDKLNLESCCQIKIDGNGTHVQSGFPLENSRFILPFTSHA